MISQRVPIQIAKAVATAAVTPRDTAPLPTGAFVRRVSQADRAGGRPAITATIAAAA